MRKPDPKNQPITISLESITDRAFAGMRIADLKGRGSDKDKVLLWYYDPRNRITTPGTEVYSTTSEFLVNICGHLFDSLEPVEECLLKAAKLAHIENLKRKYSHAKLKGAYETAALLRAQLKEKGVDL